TVRASRAAQRTRYACLRAPRSRASGYRLRLASCLLGAARAVGDRLTDVLQRAVAAHVRQHVEVVRLRGREREPLERVAAPVVVTGAAAVGDAGDRVGEGEDDPDRQHEGADRRDQILGADAGAAEVLVGVDDLAVFAAGEEEGHEGDEEAGEESPEGEA